MQKGEIIIYKTKKGPEIEVKLRKSSVWLTQSQIAILFGTQRPAITKHLINIFKSGELKEKSVGSILEHTASDGKIYKTQFYNLDAIISIGYRINSKRATQFRIWATKTLKNHLIKGYTINKKRLLAEQNKLKELQETISFLQQKSKHELLKGQEQEILEILGDYSKSLTLLEQYDKNKISPIKGKRAKFVLTYEDVLKIIGEMKANLLKKKEAGDLFGREVSHKLESIIKNLYQTFSGKELYPSIEQKAAHILYLIIKDHPFVDGNKRIASFLFVYFLSRNNYLFTIDGQRKISNNALVALALLIAVGQPKEKETMIKIISNLIA